MYRIDYWKIVLLKTATKTHKKGNLIKLQSLEIETR